MRPTSKISGMIRAGVFAELERAIAARRRQGGELIGLHIGDTHRAPPKAARFELAVKGCSDAALYGYGATAGLPGFREAIAANLEACGRAAPGATEANILLGVGATHALACAVRAVVDPGDDVLLAAPYWPLAHGIVVQAGARPVEVPLTSRLYAEPGLDVGAVLEAARTERTRAVYFVTPNNPDGKVLSRENLDLIARFARDHDLWAIADEVYADYTYDGRPHVSIARLPEMAERTLTAYSFSKSHALAGARVGVVVAPVPVVAAARRISVHTVFNVPVVSQRAAQAALADREWVEAAREEYQALRDLAASALRAAGVRFSMAEGGVYLFCDLSDRVGDGTLAPLLERIIEQGVLLAPGAAFGAAFARSARLCFTAVARPELERGLDALVRALK